MNKGFINHHKLFLPKDWPLCNLFTKKRFSSGCCDKEVSNKKFFNDSLLGLPFFELPIAHPLLIAVLKLSLIKALASCKTASTFGLFRRLPNMRHQIIYSSYSLNIILKLKSKISLE